MIVDGKAVAAELMVELKKEVAGMERPPHLTVFTCAPTFETRKFLALKRQKAAEVGIGVSTVEFDIGTSVTELIHSIQQAVPRTNGIIVQLPFPEPIDIDEVLTAIPPSHDVDALLYDGNGTDVLPPVVGAIAKISRRHEVAWAGREVVVVGHGRLVGAPVVAWAEQQGVKVTRITKAISDLSAAVRQADILVLGVGRPGLITKDMVKDGVIVFDAGTSEANGVLAGDADPAVANKALLFTPVPGGIGPITIAVLLENLVSLAKRQ